MGLKVKYMMGKECRIFFHRIWVKEGVRESHNHAKLFVLLPTKACLSAEGEEHTGSERI